jgi:hypothetical protein
MNDSVALQVLSKSTAIDIFVVVGSIPFATIATVKLLETHCHSRTI